MAKFRANLDLTSSSNKRYTDEMTFGGVDYATPRLSVSQSHALDELNYVWQDGVVQKRKGFETYENAKKDFWYIEADITKDVHSYESTTSTYTGTPQELGNAIYNVWSIGDKIVINQSGVLFYTSKEDIAKGVYTPVGRYRGLYTHDNISSPLYEVHKLPAKRLNAYIYGYKMYILTGSYVMVLEAHITRTYLYDITTKITGFSTYSLTESSHAVYTPTTTIGIIQSEASVGGTRQTYEDPNMLTDQRINSCVGGVNNKDTTDIQRTYVLDATASVVSDVIIETNKFSYENDYTIANTANDRNDGEYKEFRDTGFFYPHCGTKTYGAFGSKSLTQPISKPDTPMEMPSEKAFSNLGLIADEYCFNGIDFNGFKVITHDQVELSQYSSAYLPNVVAEVDGTHVNLYPMVDATTKTFDNKTAKCFGIQKYDFSGDTNKYYVRIFGFKAETYDASSYDNGISDYMVEIPMANNSSKKYTKSNFHKLSEIGTELDEYYDHYVIIIYAKVGDEMRYCCIPMKIIKCIESSNGLGAYYYKEAENDVVDAMDFFGNAMLLQYARNDWSKDITFGTTTTTMYSASEQYCLTSPALLSLISINTGTATQPYYSLIKDKDDLYTCSDLIGTKVADNDDGSTSRKGTLRTVGAIENTGTISYLTPAITEEEAPFRSVGRGPFSARTGYSLRKVKLSSYDTKWYLLSRERGLLSKISPLYQKVSSINDVYCLVEWYNSNANPNASTKYLKVHGYFEKTNSVTTQVVLLRNYEPEAVGESNIKIYFKASAYAYKKDYINKCTFGILYGTQNYKNRLFISGNANYPTYDWHTGDGNSSSLDYFPDASECHYGTHTPVVGYGIVSDGKLLVLKQTSDMEPSVYYRTASYSSRKDDYGNAMTDSIGNTIYEESYPLTQTNSHIGGISQNLMTDFNGDSLFVDSQGRIVGLDNEGTTYDNQRVATTRSSLIDPKISKEFRTSYSENKYCFLLYSYKNDLFYFTPSKAYYTNFDKSYEWFPIDLKGITSCTAEDNVFIFGNIDGELTFYDKTRAYYNDSTSYPIASGSLAVSSGNQLVVSDDIKECIQDGYTKLTLTNSNEKIYGFIASAAELKNVDSKLAVKVAKGTIKSSSFSFVFNSSTEYISDGCTMELLDDVSLIEDGYEWYLTSRGYDKTYTSVDIYVKGTMEDDYTIKGVDNGDNHLALLVDDIYTTSTFSLLSSIDTAYVAKESAVQASYVTAPYLTGSLGNRKVVDTYTIISDVGAQNEIFVKSITNNVTMDEIIASGGQIDYSKIDFNSIDYTRYDLPHTQTLLGKFYGSFMAFSLKSPNAVNSTLTKINFLYHYAGKTYGKS